MEKYPIGMIKAFNGGCKDATHNVSYLYNYDIYNRNRVLKGERR
tara:strand:- start:158 stop:289 length:132 start_codon:yes stop_codon:yes gene_type:complete